MRRPSDGTMNDEGNDAVRFWVNGVAHVVRDVDPRTLLVDYLRSDAVGLTGTKKACGQGGCGACTVTLARWRVRDGGVEQVAANSCLRPLCSVDGMAVTTVEGLGSVTTATVHAATVPVLVVPAAPDQAHVPGAEAVAPGVGSAEGRAVDVGGPGRYLRPCRHAAGPAARSGGGVGRHQLAGTRRDHLDPCRARGEQQRGTRSIGVGRGGVR